MVNGAVNTRLAIPSDVDAIVTVMAARGGTVDEHVDQARRMIDRLDVLLIAERERKQSAGAVFRSSHVTQALIGSADRQAEGHS